MTHFPVERLRSVELAVPDLAAACDFYERVWGLTLADRRGDAAWLRGTGTDPYLIALHGGEAAAIRSMTFRAAADLGALAATMSNAGATLAGGAIPLDEPGGGRAIVARDPRGRTIRLVHGDERAPPLPADPARPERLAHLNINSVDVDADTRFYVEALGFRLTDRSKAMAFVRTNDDHHSLVIAQAPVDTLNHVAFQLPSWEGVMRAAGRMIDAGYPIGWGPGRHGPGDNVFAYFIDPFGIVVEHTAEVLQVDDDYRVGGPADWVWPAGRVDQWGLAPPKTEACKAAQLAIPFV